MSFTCCIRGASCAACEETTGGWCASEATACGACGGIPDGLCAGAAESPPPPPPPRFLDECTATTPKHALYRDCTSFCKERFKESHCTKCGCKACDFCANAVHLTLPPPPPRPPPPLLGLGIAGVVLLCAWCVSQALATQRRLAASYEATLHTRRGGFDDDDDESDDGITWQREDIEPRRPDLASG